jgi:Flp pilus assembly pilin Flp
MRTAAIPPFPRFLPGLIRLRRRLAALWRDASGATAIEYSFIAVLVSLAAFFTLLALNDSVEAMYNRVSAVVQQAVNQQQQP